MRNERLIVLKLTAAIAIDGTIARAGQLVEMSENEAKDLLRRGKAVLAVAEAPTVAEFVAAGYLAANYPPEGYESRSTAEEIQAAVEAQAAAAAAEAADAAPAVPAAPAARGNARSR